jgi:hypothetical protein
MQFYFKVLIALIGFGFAIPYLWFLALTVDLQETCSDRSLAKKRRYAFRMVCLCYIVTLTSAYRMYPTNGFMLGCIATALFIAFFALYVYLEVFNYSHRRTYYEQFKAS